MAISRKKQLMAIAASVLTASAIASGVSPLAVKWEMGENQEGGRYTSKFVITNTSEDTLGRDWKVYFNQFPRGMKVEGESELGVDLVLRNYYCIYPLENYRPMAPGDTRELNVLQKGAFTSVSYAPDGGHFAYVGDEDNPKPINIEIGALTKPCQWEVPGREYKNYPNGKYVYDLNEQINPRGKWHDRQPFSILPAVKDLKLGKTDVKVPMRVSVLAAPQLARAKDYLVEKLGEQNVKVADGCRYVIILGLKKKKKENDNPEYYTLKVTKKWTSIEGNSEDGVLNGVKTMMAEIENRGELVLREAMIKDYPDCGYRGMMLDLARNYTKYEDLKELIDVLASYKINKFQYHFNDDEGWRLEIPGLPELTAVGSRKGLTKDEHNCLLQTYAGNGNPDDMTTTANGYITTKEFIELLKYAKNRGVDVIPEIESPGHARAAIVSMKARYNRYKDIDKAEAERYRMWDTLDTSKAVSIQGYTDNVMNLAEEGTYRFMEKVIDELAAMYKQAGVELPLIHLGGDEVARSAWDNSPSVQKLMQEKGLKGNHGISEYYFDRITKYMADKGIKAGGWQEVALDHTKEFSERVAPRFGSVTVWSTVGRLDTIPYHVANMGYPMIMCNVNNFYLDMMYSRHQDERGLNWGGPVDEFTSWNAQPFNTYRSARVDINGKENDLNTMADNKPTLENKEMLKGVQAELWTETLRGKDWLHYYIFPKILGMVERGWNAYPEWGEDYNDMTRYDADRAEYNMQIGVAELPKLQKRGINFHIGQPGIEVKDGMLNINTQYQGVEVRYTTDGSEPTEQSPKWEMPVAVDDAKVIKAKSYYLGKSSVTTYLFR